MNLFQSQWCVFAHICMLHVFVMNANVSGGCQGVINKICVTFVCMFDFFLHVDTHMHTHSDLSFSSQHLPLSWKLFPISVCQDFYATPATAVARSIMFSGCLYIQMSTGPFLINTISHYIWHKWPLGLKDKLIRMWRSKVTQMSKRIK